MTITIDYGHETEPETFKNVTNIAHDSQGVFIFYQAYGSITYRYLYYTNYVTITIH